METGTVSKIDGEQRARLEGLSRDQLECLAIQAIREHRRLVAADEIVYHEWQQAAAETKLQADHIERMKIDCVRRRQRTLAHQSNLAFMLDLLGYMPDVPDVKEPGASSPQIKP